MNQETNEMPKPLFCTDCGHKMTSQRLISHYSVETGEPVYTWKYRCGRNAFTRLAHTKRTFDSSGNEYVQFYPY